MSETVWARCGRWLEGALAHAGWTHTLGDVRGMVESGAAHLWAGDRSALVAVVQDDPRESSLVLWLAGGDLDELVERLRPAAEAWGRARGCRRVLIFGRAGWERTLRPAGYAPMARILSKEL